MAYTDFRTDIYEIPSSGPNIFGAGQVLYGANPGDTLAYFEEDWAYDDVLAEWVLITSFSVDVAVDLTLAVVTGTDPDNRLWFGAIAERMLTPTISCVARSGSVRTLTAYAQQWLETISVIDDVDTVENDDWRADWFADEYVLFEILSGPGDLIGTNPALLWVPDNTADHVWGTAEIQITSSEEGETVVRTSIPSPATPGLIVPVNDTGPSEESLTIEWLPVSVPAAPTLIVT